MTMLLPDALAIFRLLLETNLELFRALPPAEQAEFARRHHEVLMWWHNLVKTLVPGD